ncbi:CpsD/CapB family tyrosine-protein kinase, partial [Singulisphaera rosea]
AGRKVLLVDADLRNPAQRRIHGLPGPRGLADLLASGGPSEPLIQSSAVKNLDVIHAGSPTTSPFERLLSPRLAELFQEWGERYDLIIVDAPPLLEVADATILGSLVDRVVLLANASSLRYRDVESVGDWIESIHAVVIGTIFNVQDSGAFEPIPCRTPGGSDSERSGRTMLLWNSAGTTLRKVGVGAARLVRARAFDIGP